MSLLGSEEDRAHLPESAQVFILTQPTAHDIRERFLPHVAESILSRIQASDATQEQPQHEICTAIHLALSNRFFITVVYLTKRMDGSTGVRTIHFSHHQSVARCLVVTTDGQVVMTKEYRAVRQRTILNLPGGGDQGDAKTVALAEITEETGCLLTNESRILQIGRIWPEDGCVDAPVDLIAVDNIVPNPTFYNDQEDIASVSFIPWEEWREQALRGEYDDHFCVLFAARCNWNPSTKKLEVNGSFQQLL